MHSLFPGTADKPREWEAAAYPVPLLSALAKKLDAEGVPKVSLDFQRLIERFLRRDEDQVGIIQ